MLHFERLPIFHRKSKFPWTGSIKDSSNITRNSTRYLQLNWGSRFRNIRKSDIIGEVSEMFDISIRRLSAVCLAAHMERSVCVRSLRQTSGTDGLIFIVVSFERVVPALACTKRCVSGGTQGPTLRYTYCFRTVAQSGRGDILDKD